MTMDDSTLLPLVTVGIPIYNEARFLAATLESLLAQDYPHLEFVIADNGSTDDSAAIVHSFAEVDSRIVYDRSAANRGAAFTSNRVIELANGEYFMRASGHDLWSANYVSSCMHELLSRSECVIAFGTSRWIDDQGGDYPKETGWTDMRGMAALERFFTQFWGNMHPIMGVARLSTVRQVFPLRDMASADLAFLLEMSLHGEFIHAPNATWYRRETHGPQTYQQRMRRYRGADFGLGSSLLDAVTPFARMMAVLPRIVLRSPIRWIDKVLLLAMLYPTAIARYVGARNRQAASYQRESSTFNG